MELSVREQRVINVFAEEIDTRSLAEHCEVCGAAVTVQHSKDNDNCNEAIAYYVIGNAPYFLYFYLQACLSLFRLHNFPFRFSFIFDYSGSIPEYLVYKLLGKACFGFLYLY